MNHLHLLIPDLFPPREVAAEVCAGLHLPALEKLLARGKASVVPPISLEDRLCAVFSAEGIAPVRAAADGLNVDEGYWLCADPVSLQLQRAQMMLVPDVAASEEEVAALCLSLNEYFGDTGLAFFAPHPQRWYVRLDIDPQLMTTPLRQVEWQDAKFHQPQGADALHWQTMITEMQMVLYAHPLNRVREERGELVINNLWLWGGGRAVRLKSEFDALCGDNVLAGAFARGADLPQVDLLQMLRDERLQNVLCVWATLGDATQRGDFYAWREAVLQLEQDFFQPVLKHLQTGRLRQLKLEVVGGSQCYDISRGDLWKVWRTKRQLVNYAA